MRNSADDDLKDPRFADEKLVQLQLTLARRTFATLTALSQRHGEYQASLKEYATKILRFPSRG